MDNEERSSQYSSSAAEITSNNSRTRYQKPLRSRFQQYISERYDSPCTIILGLIGITALGSILAFIFPSKDQQSTSWDVASNILGYTYFLSWTLSFYPQIITNYKHPSKAIHGLSLDFIVWNIIGFALYAVYTTSLRCSAVVRKEYADRFGDGVNTTTTTMTTTGVIMNYLIVDNNTNADDSSGSNSTHTAAAVPQVKTNDVAFAWHALILTIITFIQIIYSEKKIRCCQNENDELLVTDTAAAVNDSTRWTDNVEQEGMRLEDSLGDDSFVLNEDDFHQNQGNDNHHHYYQDQSLSSHNTTSLLHHSYENVGTTEKYIHNIQWTKRIACTTKVLICILIITCIGFGISIASHAAQHQKQQQQQQQQLNLLDFLYFLSFVKVGITLIKYIPQVLLNYRRKSTSGWQIWNILLDFTGGTLSIIQLIGDSLSQDGSWTGVIGNPAKLGLGLVSISFDIIFMVQHYVLYRNPQIGNGGIVTAGSGHDTPLLADIHNSLL